MTPATLDQIRMQLKRLTSLRGCPASIDEHVSQLEGVPADWLRDSVTHWLRGQDFFPTVHQLLEAIDLIKPRLFQSESEQTKLRPSKAGKTVHIPSPFGGPGITVTIDREWHDDCTACRDQNALEFWCGPGPSDRYPDLPVRRCGKTIDHQPHDYVLSTPDRRGPQPCHCAATNPTIIRRQEAMRKFADSAPKQERRASGGR